MNWSLIDIDRTEYGTPRRLVWPPLGWRQFDPPGAMEHEQQSAADHIAQLTVGLAPIPCFAKLLGQGAATRVGMSCDELANELDVGVRDHATAIA